MTIDIRCIVCKNADRRRLVELGWNGGMGAETISRVLGGSPGAPTIMRHLKEHSDGDGNARNIEVSPETPMRERVLNLQRMQVDEIERRIALARQRADELNANLDKLAEIGGEDWAEVPRHDWSEFTDLLGKDMQSAIGSILKAQGLTDKRDMKTADLKLGLFEAMSKAGLAPVALSGGKAAPQLPSGEEPEDD